MKATQSADARMESGFSSQALLAIALVGVVLVQQSSARFIFGQCPGIMGNRDLYKKVEEVCRDCYNVFRDHQLDWKCRKDCFANRSFVLCLSALYRSNELHHFKSWISILNAGRK